MKEIEGKMEFCSLGFPDGYVEIVLRDKEREYDLEKLPKVVGGWPVRWGLQSEGKWEMSCPCGGSRIC